MPMKFCPHGMVVVCQRVAPKMFSISRLASKDFAGADRIRDALKAMGVEVTDTKDGAAWRRV